MMIVAATLAWAMSAGAAETGPAAPPAAGWDLPQLMQGMAQVKSAKRRFSERKYLSVLTEPLETSGVLLYEAPDHLEKRTLKPYEENMVLKQGIIVVENKSRHVKRTMMLHQYPAVGAFVESIRATLAGDVQTLTRYFQVTVEGDAGRWHMQLLPADKATREVVREIRMDGHHNWIAKVEILEASGDRSVMTVTEDKP